MRRTRWAALAALLPVALLTPTAGVATAVAADDGCGTASVMVLGTLKASDRTGTVADINAGGLAVGVSGQQPVYWEGTRVHQVPVPDGFDGGRVAAVNGDGLMVGWFTAGTGPSNRTPFSYQEGAPAATLLPTGGADGWADDVDDSGRIVGTVDGAGRGAVWQDGQLLAPLPVADGLSIADVTAIDAGGSVVANGTIWNNGMEDYQEVVLLWESISDPARVLGPEVGSLQGWGRPALDDHGRVVGALQSSIEDRAVYWDPPEYGGPGEVASLPGFNSGDFTAISPSTHLAAGTALMRDATSPADQAEVWPGSGPALALPRLTADGASHAYAASDNGSVGGDAVNPSGDVRPVVWTCALGQAYVPEG
ncbi:hypothetical protein [Streptomyces odontomachi]|uniref:hypothetical protein n=1 Tax=Streptomyces odontomachi TaxID=2944940 RepID=UPI00210B7F65|nr:hypothetical protein [Streptomyces sp. ODS25]